MGVCVCVYCIHPLTVSWNRRIRNEQKGVKEEPILHKSLQSSCGIFGKSGPVYTLETVNNWKGGFFLMHKDSFFPPGENLPLSLKVITKYVHMKHVKWT